MTGGDIGSLPKLRWELVLDNNCHCDWPRCGRRLAMTAATGGKIMDTDFYKGVVLSLVRFALSSVAGVLVTRGVLTADQTEGLILAASGAVFGLVTLAWVWLKSKAQAEMEKRQIQIALKADPATTSVAGVKLKAKTGGEF